MGGGFRTLPESVWLERRCLEPDAVKVKLDLEVQQNSGAPRSSGSVSTGERPKWTNVL